MAGVRSKHGAAAIVAAALLGLTACGGGHDSPQAVADQTTSAVYNDDVNAIQAKFDDGLKRMVTIDQVATISSKLHALGSYKGLSQTSADAAAGRYDYTASFDKSTVAVHVRLDPNGQVAAYRLDIPQNLPAQASTN